MNILRISLSQINPILGDFKGNISKIADSIRQAKELETDIIAFPELALCGYPPEDLLLRPSFPNDSLRAIDHLLPFTKDICAIVGYARVDDNGLVHNSAAVISDGNLQAYYDKIELPNYGVFDEKRYFTQGSKPLAIKLNDTIIAVTICEDIWVSEGVPEKGAIKNGAEIIVNISASPFHAGKIEIRESLVCGLARRSKAYVCYTNLLGGQDELVFDGGAIVANPDGTMICSSPRFDENIVTIDLPLREKDENKHSTVVASQHPGIVIVPSKIRSDKKRNINQCPICAKMEKTDEIYKAIVLGTHDYITKNGFKKVLIGLSGGIDSALTACIAVDAFGKENVIGVTMPSEFTSDGTLSDAEKLAENLDIKLYKVPISEILGSYYNELGESLGPGKPGLEKENLQARIRGNILMALSNKFGWLVLTTGNKSETAVGYCTLYGDMAGGFAVIKDVPKTMVYKLSYYVNEKIGRELIPVSTIERPPTAELRPDQKDEDSLPPYPLLDSIIHLYVEDDKSKEDIIAAGYDSNVVNDVIRMIDLSEYKRRQAPPGVKITPKAFGRDRRMPITNKYGMFSKEGF